MLGILSNTNLKIVLPVRFGQDTMYGVIRRGITDQGDARASNIDIDFGSIQFIEPIGVVVLSNFIEYLRRCKVNGNLTNIWKTYPAVQYLDDCGFFARYHGQPLSQHAQRRPTMFPLTLISNEQAMGFLYMTLIPWAATQLGVPDEALASLRVCLEEILHNINDHSGVGVGCIHAQFFPNDGELHIAISDFGTGIPNVVRTRVPQISDAEALKLACTQGFTTQSNVRNRGAGLDVLISTITTKDRGHISIISGRANISALNVGGIAKRTARTKPFVYPGTLVRVALKTDRLQGWIDEVEPEVFKW
ncbi:histidine kinase [Ottowia sp. GY511]|uniref:Histidine kinase n=1 Tax=Ottowia flava TaxID=2675430 RepID=A0ABW4KTT8_9BURK|nr:histidine kinase [Ottowia sp. GY511]TXK33605.1 histidine kinase [Ottowia sp. GY511]